jgi:alkylation response protein AidB-like acyl-CoA dehydrogenase
MPIGPRGRRLDAGQARDRTSIDQTGRIEREARQMTTNSRPGEETQGLVDELYRRAEAMVPLLRATAEESERRRSVVPAVIEAAEQAEFLRLMVPTAWGGFGLGVRPLAQIARILSHGDPSSAWVIGFLIEHNWMLARFPEATQAEVFGGIGYVRAAASLQVQGTARRAEGGWVLDGTWRYSSGMPNADWVLVTAAADEGGQTVPWTFFVPRSEITVNDDWFMAGLSASGSVSVTGARVFVPDHRSLATGSFHSRLDHPGMRHEDPIMRYPVVNTLAVMMSAFAVGIAERCVELLTERLDSHRVYGTARLEFQAARARWAEARHLTRVARMIFDGLIDRVERKGDAIEDWSEVDDGELAYDRIVIARSALEVARLVADGSGSSAFELGNPIQRYLRDVQVLANHVGTDWDSNIDRAARLQLGVGLVASDPAHLMLSRRPLAGNVR